MAIWPAARMFHLSIFCFCTSAFCQGLRSVLEVQYLDSMIKIYFFLFFSNEIPTDGPRSEEDIQILLVSRMYH